MVAVVVASSLAAPRTARAEDPVDARLRSWLRQENPVVLLLHVDGLRPDRLEAETPWDGPLMPHARRLADQAWVFEEVWAEHGDPVHSFRQLLVGGPPRPTTAGRENRGFGALVEAGFRTRAITAPMDLRPGAALPAWAVTALDSTAAAGEGRCVQDKNPVWLQREEQAVFAALDEAVDHEGGSLVVASLDHLLAPRRVPTGILSEIDPDPWSRRPATPVRIEFQAQQRLRRILERTQSTNTPRLAGNELALREHAWVVDASHRRFDRFLGRLLTKLEEPGLQSRCLLVLTAAAATPLGRHGVAEVGHGAQVGGLKVPLWMRFPPGWEQHGRDSRPRRLRDLADSIENWIGERASSPAPLFRTPPPSTSHLALGWGQLHVGARLVPLLELRWTTPDFTLLERRLPRPRLLAFDRRVDPEEFVDRYVEIAAEGDSLRAELRRHLFGATVTVQLVAVELAGRTVRVESSARPADIEVRVGQNVNPRPDPAGSQLRWTVPTGERAVLRLAVPGDDCDLRLVLEGREPVPLRLGTRPAAWGPGNAITVLAGDESFFHMLSPTPSEMGPGLHLSVECGGWLQSED